MNDHIQALRHLLGLLPAQVIAGGFVPILQFVRERLRMRKEAQRKQHLRARLVAINAFIASVKEIPAEHESCAACLDDALLEQEIVLKQLASSIARESARPKLVRPWSFLQWLFLLYQPPRPIGWALRWSFFALMIVTAAGTFRGLLHENYLPTAVLVPFLITSFVLAVLMRLAAFHIERVKPSDDCQV